MIKSGYAADGITMQTSAGKPKTKEERMGYVESNLGKDEKILARVTHSKAALASAIVTVCICLAIALGMGSEQFWPE